MEPEKSQDTIGLENLIAAKRAEAASEADPDRKEDLGDLVAALETSLASLQRLGGEGRYTGLAALKAALGLGPNIKPAGVDPFDTMPVSDA